MKLRVCRVELQCIVEFFDGRLSSTYREILQRSGIVFSRCVSGGSLTLCPHAAREGDEAK
jgi:hypothetical protein